jgi:hypothetical protein
MSERFEGPAPISPEKIKWRKQGNKPSNGEYQFVPYIDARHAAEALDDWLGPLNWKVSYSQPEKWETPGSNADEWVMWCHLSVRSVANDDWVTKSDVGKASNFEPEKGLVSDAFKRAAVAWGIGRNVYDMGIVWAKNVGDAQRKGAKKYGTPVHDTPQSEPAARPGKPRKDPPAGDGQVRVKQAKQRLLDACDGDKGKAGRLWSDAGWDGLHGNTMVDEAELVEIIEMAPVVGDSAEPFDVPEPVGGPGTEQQELAE